MSTGGPQQSGRSVSLEELVARINELREYANILASTINNYLTQQRELQLALETLKSLPENGGEGFIVVDRLSTAMIPATVDKEWSKRVLVHLGLGYYLKTDRDRAVDIVSRRSASLERLINELEKKYSAVVGEMNRLRNILETTYSRVQEASGG
ncbi:prefoldin subunit alpha [Desulfurococcus mucosus]|uniref:Prefoldin subunit alpha n=1 Tax=Desulfurococcus mucosus (strain ATCC 35584 / DSM 2162 / JCM 9187 / O7/1) TaxID=765177 RepID=E8RAB0_DESM0|nr:prefoldin subunit alpha [Desulfurococcus mucosus]ADV65416.1 prefoldin, alpha subunit [Desulfurococcus mucosus DSM 2162]